MLWGDGGIETGHDGANVGVERIDGRAVKRDDDAASPLALTIPRLFLGWGQCRSGAGAATAAGCREQVGGGMIIGVAHRISILVTVTKIE